MQSARQELWVGNSLSECHKMNIWRLNKKVKKEGIRKSLWENKKGDPNSYWNNRKKYPYFTEFNLAMAGVLKSGICFCKASFGRVFFFFFKC